MLGDSSMVRVVRGIVAMQRLSPCARSNAEDDGIVELRKTVALFEPVSHLRKH